ncbi:aspartate/glutamate racemase family protein [Motiliproteus sp. MSK22-1]|uniref:aspartate/glutamate racemase family protein n=1 Tax=Motiliproteus sp. MSK22-1 TaxID=1897630 RepID=UPI00097723C2|nr:amino acid racemase [Motiliproteus sp. MSK22-1]OMH36195.1 aspartate racemase [Motiliproteus sp. MSK22-1]
MVQGHSQKEKVVGVIGGMGPEATVDLMSRVIRETPVNDDADHIRMIVDNNSKIPSRIKALIDGNGEDPGPCMADMGLRLQRYGADFLVIPCNTAHHYYQDVVDAVDIPVVNMIEMTVDSAIQGHKRLRKAGVLASTAVLNIGLYHEYFAQRKVEAVFPESREQDKLMALIRRVKAGSHDAEVIGSFKAAADNLQAQGAECLIVACTELSVLADELQTSLPVYDASQVLAEVIVRTAKGC